MPDFHVERGQAAVLDRVDGELTVGNHVRIRAANGQNVVVCGSAHFDGSAEIDCGFECDSLRAKGRGYGFGAQVTVKGNLLVHKAADVDGSLKVREDLKAEEVDVGGHLDSKNVFSGNIRVGGHMHAKGIVEAKNVDVGGHFTASDRVKLGNLRVGGHAKIGGGVIAGEIQTRGHLEVKSKLEFGDLTSFGHVRLPANSKGERIVVFGKAEFLGNAFCKTTQVRGTAKVIGDYAAENVEVYGKLEVTGSLNTGKKLEVYGTAEVKKNVMSERIVIAGKLGAATASATEEADIEGELDVALSLRGKSIVVRKGSKVAGSLVGEQVEVGKTAGSYGPPWGRGIARMGRMTEVQDIYGGLVGIGSYSRAKRIFAEMVEMDNGSIADEVTYTKDLKLPTHYYLNKQPVRVSTLPEFPT
jgi:cytoskeletal protein CcmA (bactofilin family)